MKKIICGLIFISQGLQAQTWNAAGAGTNDDIWSFCTHNGKLYTGGAFITAGNLFCNKIAAWDGNVWDTLPNVPGGDNVSTIESYHGNLYMSRASSPGLWLFDGSAWTVPGNGLSSVAVDMIEFDNELFVGGIFTTAGTISANYIARWNDSTWQTAGAGFDNHVLCFEIYNNELYAAGRFNNSGIQPANKIAKWTGTAWVPVGGGLADDVHALQVYNGELYASSATGLFKWNGSLWSTVASLLVADMAVHGGELYIAGLFGMVQGVPANNIAKWNGSAWSALGNGITGSPHYVNSLAIYNNELYAAGNFDSAGSVAASNIARWSLQQNITENVFADVAVYPNPADRFLNVEVSEEVQCTLSDMQGRIVLNNKMGPGKHQIATAKFQPGTYLIMLQKGSSLLYSRKISVE